MRLAKDRGDGRCELSPLYALGTQSSSSGSREFVRAATPALHDRPATSHQPGPFQPVQRRIDGARGQVQPPAAFRSHHLHDGVAVTRSALERGQEQRVEMTLERFRSHT